MLWWLNETVITLAELYDLAYEVERYTFIQDYVFNFFFKSVRKPFTYPNGFVLNSWIKYIWYAMGYIWIEFQI